MPATTRNSSSWLLQYDDSIPKWQHGRDVRTDPRFRSLLVQSFPQQAFFWTKQEPLWKVADTFLGVGFGEVKVVDHRYAILRGCVPHMCDEFEGFLWVDTGRQNSTTFFAALTEIQGGNNDGAPSLFHLWIFGNRPLGKDFFSNESLPDEFLYPMQDWIDETGGRHILSAVFVGPDNQMTPLLTQSLHLPAQVFAEDKTKETK